MRALEAPVLPAPLGPFVIDGPLGEGGMGVVWRAHHPATGQAVAIKAVAARYAAQPVFLHAFHREVRAVARLVHPHIVRVFDRGVVRGDEALAGVLEAGQPWLAMELAGGGCLDQVRGRLSWTQARSLLLELLHALAHAHAHGVLHRDLKPANVLLAGVGDARPGPKLTDFGLAHAWNQEEAGESGRLAAGTPAYMPPEQASGQWRQQGPWTDLFALGRMARELVCGSHEAPLPAGVPAAFEDWVASLTAPLHSQRAQRAADAAFALRQLPDQDGDDGFNWPRSTAAAQPTPSEPTFTLDPTLPPVPDSSSPATGPSQPTFSFDAAPVPAPVASVVARLALPPPPADWRDVAPHREQALMMGAGLGLFGLRPVPLVARDAVQDELWRRLLEVRNQASVQTVLLHGPAGTGKSRLAEWICTSAHAAGLAEVLRAQHGEGGGAGDGLGPMLIRALGSHELSGVAAEAHLAQAGLSDSWDRRALLTITEQASAPQQVRFSHRDERLDALVRGIRHVVAGRVALVWLDDIQWGRPALQLAEHLQGAAEAQAPTMPMLIVLTARDEALAEHSDILARVQALQARPGVSTVAVPPLDTEQAHRMVAASIGLSGPLADTLAQRSGGNPLFTVQLIGDWIERGILQAGPDGFHLAPGADVPLPDDLHAVWSRRIKRLLDGQADGAQAALERAAVLGASVDREEWIAALAHDVDADASPLADALRDALLDQRLAVAEAQGWSFVHGMLRESLLRGAAEQGRLLNHHHRCADVLTGDARALRRSRHLLAAGRPDHALSPLLSAVEHHTRAQDIDAVALLDQATSLAAGLDLAEVDPRRARVALMRARMRRLLGDHKGACTLAEQAVSLAAQAGEPLEQARALTELGMLARMRSKHTQARTLLSQGLALAEQVGAKREISILCLELGFACLYAGDREAGRAYGARCLEVAEQLGDPLELGEAHRWHAHQAWRRDDLAAVARHVAVARKAFESCGYIAGLIDLHAFVGDAARRVGDSDAATDAYSKAQALGARSTLSSRDVYPLVNLAQVDSEAGRYGVARERLAKGRRVFDDIGKPSMVGAMRMLEAAAAAGDGDLDAARTHLAESTRLLDQTGFSDHDMRRGAELGARFARAAGDDDLGRAFARAEATQAERLARA